MSVFKKHLCTALNIPYTTDEITILTAIDSLQKEKEQLLIDRHDLQIRQHVFKAHVDVLERMSPVYAKLAINNASIQA